MCTPSVCECGPLEEPSHPRKLAMVFRRFNGRASLEPIDVDSTDSGQQILEKVRAKQRELMVMESRMCCLHLLWTRAEAAIAEIKWVRDPDNIWDGIGSVLTQKQSLTDTKPDGHNETRIDLKNFERDSLLTEALRDPALLANKSDFVLEYDNLALAGANEWRSLVGQQVLLVYIVGDKLKIAWLLLFLVILSPALGTIVGSVAHRADVGVAVGAGIFALTSFLQALAAWLHK